jgi:hypothetical protein
MCTTVTQSDPDADCGTHPHHLRWDGVDDPLSDN